MTAIFFPEQRATSSAVLGLMISGGTSPPAITSASIAIGSSRVIIDGTTSVSVSALALGIGASVDTIVYSSIPAGRVSIDGSGLVTGIGAGNCVIAAAITASGPGLTTTTVEVSMPAYVIADGRYVSLHMASYRAAGDGRHVTIAFAAGSVVIALSPSELPPGLVGESYSVTLSASGGTGPYTYSIGAGALPAGLVLAGDAIAGLPTASGDHSVTVVATDSTPAWAGGPNVGSAIYALAIVAPLPPPWRGLQNSIGLPWRPGISRHRQLRVSWNASQRLNAAVGQPWVAGTPINASIHMRWSPVPPLNVSAGLAWGTPDGISRSIVVPWIDPDPIGRSIVARWSRRSAQQHVIGARWRSPPALQIGAVMPWRLPSARQQAVATLWRSPPNRQRYLDLPWERGMAAPWRILPPPIDPPPPPPPPNHDGRHVSIRFSCPRRTESSRYLSIPFGPWQCYVGRRQQKVIIVYHTATLVRLPDLASIAASDLTIRGDLSSALWSLSASISDAASLALLRPGPSGAARRVRATLNGHAWEFLIDNIVEDERHGGNARSAVGRSPTSALARGAAALATMTETSARDASQLAADILDGTDFTLDWQATDWLVPAGAWSYSEAAPLDALRTLADACGAVVQTSLDGAALQVVPAYRERPWRWFETAPDVDLVDDYTLQRGTGSAQGMRHNYVEVRGETGVGIRGEVIITGTAGDLPLPQVTNPLVTAVAVAEARGIFELSKVGPIGDVSVELPLFPSTTSPGLVLPGKLVRVAGDYKARSTGVSINARWTEQGLSIRQTVAMERHYDA